MTAALLLAAAIAFPKEGSRLPLVSRCYVIGSADATNVVVQGHDVPVYRTGGWVTMVDVVPGTNTVRAGDAAVTFFVEQPPKGSGAAKSAEKKWEKLKYAGDVPRPHPAGKRPDAITVVIDPGHGGTDTGAMTPLGRMEKDANLAIAKFVRDELVSRGYNVVMTRDDDSFPELYDRPKLAHANGADAFISIHHNAPPFDKDPRQVRYTAVYAWNDIGERLAKAINSRMAAALGRSLKNNGVMHANFAVTRNPEIPSCLVEVDFITTPEGEEECWDEARRRKLAEAIADGFRDWATARSK